MNRIHLFVRKINSIATVVIKFIPVVGLFTLGKFTRRVFYRMMFLMFIFSPVVGIFKYPYAKHAYKKYIDSIKETK